MPARKLTWRDMLEVLKPYDDDISGPTVLDKPIMIRMPDGSFSEPSDICIVDRENDMKSFIDVPLDDWQIFLEIDNADEDIMEKTDVNNEA